MSILNKYKHWGFKIQALEDKYWDFVLSKDLTPSINAGSRLTDRCLSTYIDFGDKNCFDESGICSYSSYTWEGTINNPRTYKYLDASGNTQYTEDEKEVPIGIPVRKVTLLEDIGYTGIDNGLIYYGGWDKVSNKEFFEIFTNSKLEIPEGDNKLHLHAVTGNTCLYDYPMDYNEEGGYYELRGGFFQGFYKLFGYDYQILPQHIEDAWHVEITLRPHEHIQDEHTLNQEHCENEGIFFYMGTRAENKFAQFYNTDFTKYEHRKRNNHGKITECEYFISEEDQKYLEALRECEKEDPKSYNKGQAFLLMRFIYEYGYDWDSKCGCPSDASDVPCKPKKKDCNLCDDCTSFYRDDYNEEETPIFFYKGGDGFDDDYFKDKDYKNGLYNDPYLSTCDEDYYEPNVIISGATLTTSDGHPIEESGYYEINTDNKFLTFNRTKYGFTVSNWDEDTVVVLTGLTADYHNAKKTITENNVTVDTDNMFLLMNRTKSGYTVETLNEYYAENAKQYNLLKDIKGNSFALKLNHDGSIGYRYLIKDCYAPDGYSIKEESTFSGLVTEDNWYTINVAFKIMNGYIDECGKPRGERKMKIYIYINGYLKFVSQELPEFNFRELNDIYEKQEGVPFNISIGGGTQGLCDSVWLDYNKAFDYVLPIEENFAGTFIGDIKSFKFYTCPLEYMEIKNNFLYEKSKQK